MHLAERLAAERAVCRSAEPGPRPALPRLGWTSDRARFSLHDAARDARHGRLIGDHLRIRASGSVAVEFQQRRQILRQRPADDADAQAIGDQLPPQFGVELLLVDLLPQGVGLRVLIERNAGLEDLQRTLSVDV